MRRTGRLLVASFFVTSPAVGQSSGFTLTALDFMAGCWMGSAGDSTVIEEIYTRPSNNVMLGTTRYIRNDTTTMFEFSLLNQDSTGVSLLPYPRGRRSEDSFALTHSDDHRVVFEAPQHDFPKRVIYRAISKDRLEARIDGGEGSDRVMEWELTRMACPGT